MHARLQPKKTLQTDFPFLADEIAEPHSDMKIKVTTFTESQKFYYTIIHVPCFGCIFRMFLFL